jgi:glycine/D-amino acid oxidase-like deaminating enzyme
LFHHFNIHHFDIRYSIFSMRLYTHHTYSLEAAGPVPDYAALDEDRDVEVLVIGAGISGALTAWELQKAGAECMIIDRREAAGGSTAASTSLLQYELDTALRELSRRIGSRKASQSYLRCYEALPRLEAICREGGAGELFEPRPSLQYASSSEDMAGLEEEYRLRRGLGFSVELLTASDLQTNFGISKAGGLLSRTAAQVDAFALAHRLLRIMSERGAAVHAHTEAVSIDRQHSGITVITGSGRRIRAKHLVMACGYESQQYLPRKLEDLSVTYALASEPVMPKLLWYERSLIWETAKPYLYLRTTSDNRILIGGKDTPFDGRTDFPLCRQKAKALEDEFHRLFPAIPFRPAFSWAGVFAGTADGLPYIGQVAGQPHTSYALGFGGNGILFSVLAADIISSLIRGRQHPDAALFSFDRV